MAMPRPVPRPAPVTMAVLPSRRFIHLPPFSVSGNVDDSIVNCSNQTDSVRHPGPCSARSGVHVQPPSCFSSSSAS
jgi:hypothetical protein